MYMTDTANRCSSANVLTSGTMPLQNWPLATGKLKAPLWEVFLACS